MAVSSALHEPQVGADTPAASYPSVAAEFAVPTVSVLPPSLSPPVAEALPQSLEMATAPEPSLGSVGHGTVAREKDMSRTH